MIENEIQLFIFLRFLFIWVNFSYSTKPRRVSDFTINFFWNCQDSEEKETKKDEFGTIFLIVILFKLFEI